MVKKASKKAVEQVKKAPPAEKPAAPPKKAAPPQKTKAQRLKAAPPPVETVTLQCIQKKAFSFELPHEIWCEALGVCECKMRERVGSEHDRKTGIVAPVISEHRCPRTMRIEPGVQNAVTLHPAVLDCPGVGRALTSSPKIRPRLRRI